MPVVPVSAFKDNYIWAIIDEEQGIFDCVDPGDAKPVLLFAQENQLVLRDILLTHHHSDHTGGVEELIQTSPTTIVYGPKDARITNITQIVVEHQELPIGQHYFQVLFNPGHTSTHISYYESKQGWLFCGDTLFSAGCGRVFDGTIEQLHDSLMMFKQLPKTTQIFCAHEYTLQNLRFAQEVEPQNETIRSYSKQLRHLEAQCSLPSRLELELLINPFLRTDQAEVQRYAQMHGADSKDSLAVFSLLRTKKNEFK